MADSMSPNQLFIVALTVGVITGLPAVITACVAAWMVIRRIDDVKHHVNSRLDQLVAAEKLLSFGEGESSERKKRKGK